MSNINEAATLGCGKGGEESQRKQESKSSLLVERKRPLLENCQIKMDTDMESWIKKHTEKVFIHFMVLVLVFVLYVVAPARLA